MFDVSVGTAGTSRQNVVFATVVSQAEFTRYLSEMFHRPQAETTAWIALDPA